MIKQNLTKPFNEQKSFSEIICPQQAKLAAFVKR